MDNNYSGNICYCRKCNGIVHTIKKGDSLYLLSRYYKVPIGEIMAVNPNMNVYNLQIGEELCIPVRRSDMLRNEFGNTTVEQVSSNIPIENITMMSSETDSMETSNVRDMQDDHCLDKSMKLSDAVQMEDMTVGKFMKCIKELWDKD